MEKLSAKKRLGIARYYLSGLSYDEIAGKAGVSKGTVANIVSELKAGNLPEASDVAEHIELLRELSLDLKHTNLTPGQCATGLAVLNRITQCGLEPADIDRWPVILKSAGTEEEAKEFVNLVYGIQEVQKETGLSLDKLHDNVLELEKKATELEPVSKKLHECRKQLAELTGKRDNLVKEVATLEQKYGLLNPRVKDLEKREQDLAGRIKGMEKKTEEGEAALATLSKEKQRLLEVGLSFEALTELSHRAQSIAQHHHIKPAELRDRLLHELESLGEAIGLETLVQKRQAELKDQEQAVAAYKKESQSLKAVVEGLKQQKADLEASIKETREKVGAEMTKVTAAARDMISTVTGELRRGHEEALAEVRRLKDEAIEVGKEVGQYEEMLRANRWLSELLALVREEKNIEGKRVRVIALLVLRGIGAWLRENEGTDPRLSNTSFTVKSLTEEVEQWKF